MTEDQQFDNNLILLALTRFADIGPRLMNALLQRYGDLGNILHADRTSLSAIEGMTPELVERIKGSDAFLEDAARYRADLKQRDIAIHTRLDDDFPPLLFELNDPPPLLYVRGRLPDRTRKSVAIVGAEEATNQGIELTVTMGRRSAEAGVEVVSSLRRGIDAAAHVGAKAGGGVSFAVVSGGFDHIDLTEQMPLAIDIARTGGVISEYSPDAEPDTDTYRACNRILVGLAQAVVITEVYKDSVTTLDLLSFCNETGKLTFILIDPRNGALADKDSLSEAARCGAIPMVGLDKINDILDALV
ncbi:MAG: DNA-processing protein DprA [candidate division Zixibacteria bacterium]|nr:DNA-processing protein DprA [candidate division Zixibacteria bacterium]